MWRYQVKLIKDTNGTIRVEFPAVPEANTFGGDREEALTRAVNAVESALMLYIDDRQEIPAKGMPRPAVDAAVTLPALTEARSLPSINRCVPRAWARPSSRVGSIATYPK